MPNVVSPNTVASLMAETTGEVFLELVTIEASGFETAYVVNNNEDVVSRNNTYIASNFTLPKPDEHEDQLPVSSLKIDNVDRRIVEIVRELTGTVNFTLELVTLSDPDTVEEGPYRFTLKSADYDALYVTATLGYENILSEVAKYGDYTPSDFPSIF